MNAPPPSDYVGHENLEVMADAVNYNRWLVALALKFVARKGRILDFGAGTGTLTRLLSSTPREVVAIEPDAHQARQLEAEGIETLPGLTKLADASVAGIVTFNVLEHIEDDEAVLRAMRPKLLPGGRLFIYVPAFPILYSSMDRKVGHVRRYRKRQLVERLERAGYRVDIARHADSIGFFAALAFRALGNEGGTLSPTAIRLYDRFVFPLSRMLDYALCGSFGKNLMVVATRPA